MRWLGFFVEIEMALKPRRMTFEAPALDGAIRLYSDRVDARRFDNGNTVTTVNLARVMQFKDPFYGTVKLTRKMFESFIENFKANTYGQEIFIDVAHSPSDGAAATVRKLFMDGQKLRAEVEFTEFGIDAVKKRGFRYLSIDFTDNYLHPETQKEHGPLLFGAGLTIRPRVKGLDPVTLSHDKDELPALVSDRVAYMLAEELEQEMKKHIDRLRKQLSEQGLSEKQIAAYVAQLEVAGKTLGENDDAIGAVIDAFVESAKQLAEAGKAGNDAIKLDFSSLNIPAPTAGLAADDLNKLLDERDAKAKAEVKKLAESLDANVKQFSDAIEEAEGLKQLSEDDRKALLSAADMITANMTAEQVTKLAEHQIALGNKMVAATKLSSMGYAGPAGSMHITVDERNSVMKLQEEINRGLRGTSQHAARKLVLAEDPSKQHPMIGMVLAEFDRIHAVRLAHEAKQFAAGSTGIGDTQLPIGFQRTVIMEALSDLRVLELLQTLTDPSAQATTEIPYETRDGSAILNNGVVYEGQPIRRASVQQAMDTAYIVPMKLGFIISEEVMHFTRASAINWDAYGRNVASNARFMRELIVRRICNELQRSADAYSATAVANEGLDAQLTGAKSIVKTANFPIVRPHQQRDLKGTAVGALENPIVVRLNGAAIAEYDGSGTQAPGTYYSIINYNLGYVQFVDESGTPATPPNAAGVDDISYSYSTNVEFFDMDDPGSDIGLHLNGLLRAFGDRKTLMAQDRFVVPDFMLMSYTLNNSVTNANNFEADSKRNGTDTTSQGDLATVKGVGAFSTNAPSVDLGEERAIIGQRNVMTYTVAKPFVTGQPFEVTDANGYATGQKQAYGTEFSAMKVPTPIRGHLTSLIAYSVTARAAV